MIFSCVKSIFKTKINIIKIVKNLCILKLFNLYIMKKNKFEKAHENNLLTLKLFFISLHFFLFYYFFFFIFFPLNLWEPNIVKGETSIPFVYKSSKVATHILLNTKILELFYDSKIYIFFFFFNFFNKQ